MLQVHQIVLTDAQVNEVNSSTSTYPAFYSAYLDTHFGDMDKALEMNLHQHVADISTDDLETAFMVMNRWNDVDEKLVHRLAPLHSLSVGDILVKEDGTRHVVAHCGFKQLN